MNIFSKLSLVIFLLYSSNTFADLNGCISSCSPDGVGGSVCSTNCPQSNQGGFMDAYNRAESQRLQNQLMQQKLDMLRQAKPNDNGLNYTQYDRFETRSSEYNAYMNECMAKINSTQDGKIVRNEIIYLDSSDKNKIELSINNNKLTGQQKEVVKRYTHDVQTCRDKTNEMLVRLPSQFVSLILASFDNLDSIFIDLLTDKITIGDANIARSKLLSKLFSDWSQATEKLQR